MTDVHTPAIRSKNMQAVRNRNTKPELLVRKLLYSRGFRFRLNVKTLPAKPDIVFPKYRAIILVNGCFWHGHDCLVFKWPKTRTEFWKEKITGNQQRDKRNLRDLQADGWRVLTLWECALKGRYKLPLDVIADLIENWLLVGGETSIEIQGSF
ncbi:very short patch repair endonuclease [Endozoicomonas elysicola]|uniref:Very short patch repair endonuclease n=1 Tax=Endozoicomonas elysicola TaxID=305900 RepID=A0A081KE14_9GAMM|nr:very short patch repair endonuclease [Endozoicomonas elysicola]KEI72390.1 DNA glycosylase [Endozoicomonas elysicola]